MIILLSGEGPTDLGKCSLSLQECSNDENGNFIYGVLAHLIDNIINAKLNYSLADVPDSFHYKSKSFLKAKAKSLTGGKKLMMRGVDKAPETSFFYSNARALGVIALELQKEKKSPVIAILFRDSDGTKSATNNNWKSKYTSMVTGFKSVNCLTGVPMLAKPKSEAWLLAACKENPYQHCRCLENESGNDDSLNPLKEQLASQIGMEANSINLVQWFLKSNYDHEAVAREMPSFGAFLRDFTAAIEICQHY